MEFINGIIEANCLPGIFVRPGRMRFKHGRA